MRLKICILIFSIFLFLFFIDVHAKRLNKNIIKKYESLKQVFPCELKISSGWRSKAHNHRIGGVRHSYHLRGMAIDVILKKNGAKKCTKTLRQLAISALPIFEGVILYRTHVHLDVGNRVYHLIRGLNMNLKEFLTPAERKEIEEAIKKEEQELKEINDTHGNPEVMENQIADLKEYITEQKSK